MIEKTAVKTALETVAASADQHAAAMALDFEVRMALTSLTYLTARGNAYKLTPSGIKAAGYRRVPSGKLVKSPYAA